MISVTHKNRRRVTQYSELMTSLNRMGCRDSEIARALGYTPQYMSVLRTKRVPPVHVLAAVQALLVSELARAEAQFRAEADALAIERQAIEAEAIAA